MVLRKAPHLGLGTDVEGDKELPRLAQRDHHVTVASVSNVATRVHGPRERIVQAAQRALQYSVLQLPNEIGLVVEANGLSQAQTAANPIGPGCQEEAISHVKANGKRASAARRCRAGIRSCRGGIAQQGDAQSSACFIDIGSLSLVLVLPGHFVLRCSISHWARPAPSSRLARNHDSCARFEPTPMGQALAPLWRCP